MTFWVVVDGTGIVISRFIHEIAAEFRAACSEHGDTGSRTGHHTAQQAERGPVVYALLTVWCIIPGDEIAREI